MAECCLSPGCHIGVILRIGCLYRVSFAEVCGFREPFPQIGFGTMERKATASALAMAWGHYSFFQIHSVGIISTAVQLTQVVILFLVLFCFTFFFFFFKMIPSFECRTPSHLLIILSSVCVSLQERMPQTPPFAAMFDSSGYNRNLYQSKEDGCGGLYYHDNNLLSGSLEALIQHLVPSVDYYPDVSMRCCTGTALFRINRNWT